MLLQKILAVYSRIYVENVPTNSGQIRDLFKDKESDLRNNHCALTD